MTSWHEILSHDKNNFQHLLLFCKSRGWSLSCQVVTSIHNNISDSNHIFFCNTWSCLLFHISIRNQFWILIIDYDVSKNHIHYLRDFSSTAFSLLNLHSFSNNHCYLPLTFIKQHSYHCMHTYILMHRDKNTIYVHICVGSGYRQNYPKQKWTWWDKVGNFLSKTCFARENLSSLWHHQFE